MLLKSVKKFQSAKGKQKILHKDLNLKMFLMIIVVHVWNWLGKYSQFLNLLNIQIWKWGKKLPIIIMMKDKKNT